MVLLHPTTPLIGVIGGLAAFAIAVALFVVLRRRIRREPTKRPQSALHEPEGASPYKSGDNTAQGVPGNLMHQKLYVSLRSAVRFVLY